ncbi:F-box/kelch-repeat protein At3g06240-like [Vicia villosa]|uniref:F-box/kelch-repeat protein At3g06240-like n=1 Tax=Vicia villosa TaxID=3911 RepID=UPI00273B6DB3|nr:F-box/kelch-repeat protein At3g06240-like [Vicia villosa]
MFESTTTTSEKKVSSSNFINDDLSFNILSKLPLKSLKRFGCVSKSWSLLFENHYFMTIFRSNFISNHQSLYNDTSLLLRVTGREFHILSDNDDFEFENTVDLPNPFQEEDPFFKILDSGSITGILCLYRDQEVPIVFWNPSIQQFKVIPPSPGESVPRYQMFLSIINGFGYDHVSDDYKLIKHIYYFRPSHRDCEDLGLHDVPREGVLDGKSLWEIYSLRNNSWKKLDDMNVCFEGVSYNCSAHNNIYGQLLYLDGTCHWWNFIDLPDAQVVLVSFDLVNEVLCTTLVPLDIHFGATHLVELCGSVALISWTYRSTCIFDISILSEIGVKELWTKLFSVGPLSCIENPIGSGKNGDIFFIQEDGEIVCLNLNTQIIEELDVRGDKYHQLGQVLMYKENFIQWKG